MARLFLGTDVDVLPIYDFELDFYFVCHIVSASVYFVSHGYGPGNCFLPYQPCESFAEPSLGRGTWRSDIVTGLSP